jgi:hypothetical protein
MGSLRGQGVAAAFVAAVVVDCECLEVVELRFVGYEEVRAQLAYDRVYCYAADGELGCTGAIAADLEDSDIVGEVERLVATLVLGAVGSGTADIETLVEELDLLAQALNDLSCFVFEAGSSESRKTLVLHHCLVVIVEHYQLRAEAAAEHHICFSV